MNNITQITIRISTNINLPPLADWNKLYKIIRERLDDLNIELGFSHEDSQKADVWLSDDDRKYLSEAEIERIINQTLRVIDEFPAQHWEFLSTSVISEDFMAEYADKLDWELISQFQNLSEEFMERHSDKLDWELISQYQQLSEAFIAKHADKLDWELISQYQQLSESFISKHADKLPE